MSICDYKPSIYNSTMSQQVYTQMPMPCIEKVRSTVFPRVSRVVDRSCALLEANGYSPPTPIPKIAQAMANIRNSPSTVGPYEQAMRIAPTSMIRHVNIDPARRPNLSPKMEINNIPKMTPQSVEYEMEAFNDSCGQSVLRVEFAFQQCG